MHVSKKIFGALVVAAAIGLAANATPASAQPYNYGGPGVATVTVANGSVVIVRADSEAQVAATVNAPLVPGDYIATGSGSTAEVQFDGISMLRLAGNTQVRFVNLTPNSIEAQLAVGTVDLAELQGADGSPQIDTPSLTVRPNQSGDYRVSVLSNGETLVTVRNGAATVASPNGTQTVTPGSTLVAYGPSVRLQNAIGFDSFDQFNIARDQALVSAYNSNPYLSPMLAGCSNLANYGQWQNVPGYGYAWAPNNQSATNFAPYQNGQWVWEPGYGYTWVDNAPYGCATTHYGTWFNNPTYGGWMWQPPAYQYQTSAANLSSMWLPAVVSFFLTGNKGSGGGLGSILGGLLNLLGTSSADIGWIPLAPGEQYQPWYGQNYSYPSPSVTNVTNITNIYNYYSNAQYYRGITMCPVSAWRAGNFKRLIIVSPRQVRRILLVRGAVPVVPTTANLHFASTIVVRRPIVLSRTFVVAPRFVAKAPEITRTSFKTEQATIRSIASARPTFVALPLRRFKVVHPVYHPVVHAPAHLTVMKPVKRPFIHLVKPVPSPAPAAKPVKLRVMHPVKTVHTPAPIVKSLKLPAKHVVKPLRTPTPVVKPTKIPALHVVKPEHTPVAKPVNLPAIHPVKPAHTTAPAPTSKPTVSHTKKPAPHATPKPSPSPA